MTHDFLIGAIRASQDLHPQVRTELEEILFRAGKEVEPIWHEAIRMWECPECRNPVHGADNYCGGCGRKLKWG